MSSSLSVLVTGLTWSSFSCLPVVSVACANVKCFSCASSEMSLRVFCSFICRLPHFSTAELWHFIRLQGLYLVFPSFLQVLLQEQKFLIWMKSNLLIFFFFYFPPIPLLGLWCLKTLCLLSGLKDILFLGPSLFSLTYINFMFLHFKFRFMTNFEYILCTLWDSGEPVFSCPPPSPSASFFLLLPSSLCQCPVAPIKFVESTI